MKFIGKVLFYRQIYIQTDRLTDVPKTIFPRPFYIWRDENLDSKSVQFTMDNNFHRLANRPNSTHAWLTEVIFDLNMCNKDNVSHMAYFMFNVSHVPTVQCLNWNPGSQLGCWTASATDLHLKCCNMMSFLTPQQVRHTTANRVISIFWKIPSLLLYHTDTLIPTKWHLTSNPVLWTAQFA